MHENMHTDCWIPFFMYTHTQREPLWLGLYNLLVVGLHTDVAVAGSVPLQRVHVPQALLVTQVTCTYRWAHVVDAP